MLFHLVVRVHAPVLWRRHDDLPVNLAIDGAVPVGKKQGFPQINKSRNNIFFKSSLVAGLHSWEDRAGHQAIALEK